MPFRPAAALAALAALAFAPAGAEAANVIRTTSLTASAVVPPGSTSTVRLECPAPWVALSGAVTSKGTGVTRASSRPGDGAGDWRFRFAADGSARRTARTVLRCLRLDLPAGMSGARLNVQTRSRSNIAVPAGGTASVAVRCGSRAWVATGYGFADGRGTVRLASVVPSARGWDFVLENTGSAAALADVSVRCLRRTVTAGRGGGSSELRFRVSRPSFSSVFGFGPSRRTSTGRCGAGRFSLAAGARLDAADAIELVAAGPIGSRRVRWSFRNVGRGDGFLGYMVCLARGTGFR